MLRPDLAHGRDAARLAERITAGLATPFAVGGHVNLSPRQFAEPT